MKLHSICSKTQRVNQYARPSIKHVGCPICCFQVWALDHAKEGTADMDYPSKPCHPYVLISTLSVRYLFFVTGTFYSILFYRPWCLWWYYLWYPYSGNWCASGFHICLLHFIIYMNDILMTSKNFNSTNYADDTNLVRLLCTLNHPRT